MGRAIGQVVARWPYWVVIGGIVVTSVYLQFSLRRLGIPRAWMSTVGWLIVALTVIACWVVVLSFRKSIRRILWRLLVEHGIACCTSCGYDLTGNTSGICPECGTPIRKLGTNGIEASLARSNEHENA